MAPIDWLDFEVYLLKGCRRSIHCSWNMQIGFLFACIARRTPSILPHPVLPFWCLQFSWSSKELWLAVRFCTWMRVYRPCLLDEHWDEEQQWHCRRDPWPSSFAERLWCRPKSSHWLLRSNNELGRTSFLTLWTLWCRVVLLPMPNSTQNRLVSSHRSALDSEADLLGYHVLLSHRIHQSNPDYQSILALALQNWQR